MHKSIRAACALALLGITPSYAQAEIEAYVPEAEVVGSGRLNVLFWEVYDAKLFAPEGVWQEQQPFALQLSYLRDISGKQIADKSAEEMRRLEVAGEMKLADWHAQMRRIFPDVEKGDTITGIYTKGGETIFYFNGEEAGRISEPEFGKAFFDIWLSQHTTAPDLRKKLLGLS